MPDSNFFRSVQDSIGVEGVAVAGLQDFEQSCLDYVLWRFKLRHLRHALKDRFKATTGRSELRFTAFNDYFSTFPFLLGISKLQGITLPGKTATRTPFDYQVHRDPASVEASRFKEFFKVPFVVAYQDFYETVTNAARGRKVALIYNRRGFKHGMVIHNDDSECYWSTGLSWVYKFPSGQKLYVQPFKDLLNEIHEGGRGWRLEG